MKYDHHYYVYLVASRTRILYCGVTNNIGRRVAEHRERSIPGFSAKYLCERLVWYEQYQYINNAIDREKQIKRWNRAKKLWLIEQMNPTWVDLSESWRLPNAFPSTSHQAIPNNCHPERDAKRESKDLQF